MSEAPPLDIERTLESKDLGSYKEPWRQDKCISSVQSTSLYEAGCNVFWFDPGLVPRKQLPVAPSNWATVNSIASTLFSKDGLSFGGVTPSSLRRLVFPTVIPAFVDDLKTLERAWFPGTLQATCGHVVLHAWYLSVHHALNEGAQSWLLELWQAGLTATARVRLLPAGDMRLALIDAMHFSETAKLQEKIFADTFADFADKLLEFISKEKQDPDVAQSKKTVDAIVKNLSGKGVRFGGAPLNKTMYGAAQQVVATFDADCRRLIKLIDWNHGTDVLGSSYNKCSRLVQLSTKAASSCEYGVAVSPSTCVKFVLQMMWVSLEKKFAKAKWFTLDILDKQRDGRAGWLSMTLTKWKLIAHLTGPVVENLKNTNATVHDALQRLVLPTCQTPMLYLAQTRKDEDGGVTPAEHVAKPDGVTLADGTGSPEPLSPAAQSFRNLRYSIYGGEHDKALVVIATAEKGIAETLGAALPSDEVKALHNAVHTFLRLTATLSAVPSSDTGAPAAGPSRVLQLHKSTTSASEDEDHTSAKQEREDVWRRSQIERRKFVHIMAIPSLSKENLDSAFTKCPLRDFAGKHKESHRAFVCDASLLSEHPTEPWAQLAPPPALAMKTIAEWFKEFKGPVDFLLFFDGRSRQCMLLWQEYLANRQHVHDLLLLYSGTQAAAARTRKVALSASKVETLLLCTPCARTQLDAEPRDHFNVLGESSTHDKTYSGVHYKAKKTLPRITTADKKAILGNDACGGVPPRAVHSFGPNPCLFWQEAKPPELLQQLIRDFKLHAIFDVTPGAGTWAEASMLAGVQYVGVTTSPVHQVWLANVCDRLALTQIVTAGRPLYQRELADHIRKHFEDELKRAGECGEDEEWPEVDGEAFT